MPRVSDVVSLMVCRVPNDTSTESVYRMRAADTSARAATIRGSFARPMVTSGPGAGPAGVPARLVAWAAAEVASKRQQSGSVRRMGVIEGERLSLRA